MQKRAYVGVATAAVVAAAATSILCLIADSRIGVDKLGLFARSGALIALSAAALEYQLGIGSYLRNVYVPGQTISMGELAEAFNLTDNERRLRAFAHSMLLIGTLVWAFGGLVFRVL